MLDAIDEAEAAVMDVTQNPRGTLFVAAPLGIGRRFIAPHIPAFKDAYPQIELRLRLSDRVIDVTAEGLDVAFHLGHLEDSTLKVRIVADCPRLLCAAPAYIARRGMPADGDGAGARPARLPEPALSRRARIPVDAADPRRPPPVRDLRTVRKR